jgi:hypothetical protein
MENRSVTDARIGKPMHESNFRSETLKRGLRECHRRTAQAELAKAAKWRILRTATDGARHRHILVSELTSNDPGRD